MTTGAIIFMVLSWTVPISLMVWSYSRVLKKKKHHDPDSIGPLGPSEPGTEEGKMDLPDDHR